MFTMLLMGAVVLIAAALPSFLSSRLFSKADKIGFLIITGILLVIGIIMSDAISILYRFLAP